MRRTISLLTSIIIVAQLEALVASSVFEDAEAALELYRITVDKVVANATTQLEQTQNEVVRVGQGISGIVGLIVDSTQLEFFQQLDNLEKLAVEHDLDPLLCTLGPKAILTYWLGDQKYYILQCMEDIVREANRTFGEAFDKLKQVEATVLDFHPRIENCRQTEDSTCAEIVIAQIQLQNELIPIIIDDDIQDITQQFIDVDLKFQECSRNRIQELIDEGDRLINGATVCIDKLLSGELNNF